MNEKLKNRIKELRKIELVNFAKELAANKFIFTCDVKKKSLKIIDDIVSEALKRGNSIFYLNMDTDIQIAMDIFEKSNPYVVSGSTISGYYFKITEKGLKKLDKELKKLDMGGI